MSEKIIFSSFTLFRGGGSGPKVVFFSENLPKCASPCVNMQTTFGFPFFSNNNQSTGFVKLYFKNIVKITEDFVSYDLLRYYQKETFIKQQSYFSMVAEIGGYSGLLIGFSLMDLVSMYRNFLLFF